MPRQPLPNYLRSQRLLGALSQKQLSLLLGFRTPTQVSKFEKGERLPPLRVVLAYEVIFGRLPSELFEGHYVEVEEEVMRRGHALFELVEHRTDPKGIRQRELLLAMLARATNKPKQ